MAPLSSRKSKTSRFPVARIKKIMQTDEEVGKLASATPVMISKSLECFMQHLIGEACKEVRQRGSKKLTGHHLKQAIMTRPTLDFLLPITANITDPTPQEDKPKSTMVRKPRLNPDGTPAIRKKTVKSEDLLSGSNMGMTGGEGMGQGAIPDSGNLPLIGTWKRDPVGVGGSGEGGRGMFDDYEEDDDDY